MLNVGEESMDKGQWTELRHNHPEPISKLSRMRCQAEHAPVQA